MNAIGKGICQFCFSDYGRCEHSTPSEKDLLIEKLTAERDNALAQNAELVAHIEAIKDAWMAAGSWPDTAEEKQVIANAINAAPTQHLRDRDAEVARAGFVAGYEKCWRESYGTKPNTDSVDEYADSYAERVKAGSL